MKNILKLPRFKLVDYVTTTGTYEVCFAGRLPKEVPSFKSLWLPFDNVTWAFILGSAIAIGMVLIQIERSWNVLNHNRTKYLREFSEGRSSHFNDKKVETL